MNEAFYIVTRIFYKGDNETHSVQIFSDSRQATQRFYGIIAADLADNAITYQFASICDNWGNNVLNPVVYDRRGENSEEEA